MQAQQEVPKTPSEKFPILVFFKHDHLPQKLSEISRPFAQMAIRMAESESNHPQEISAGLRKLLEAKDCAVRAALP